MKSTDAIKINFMELENKKFNGKWKQYVEKQAEVGEETEGKVESNK